MSDKAFLVNTARCTGCRSCQTACKQWNSLPGEISEFFGGPEMTNPGSLSAVTWNHVVFYKFTAGENGKPEWNIVHKKCFHCKIANCAGGCPVKAISKVDGWNIIDQDKCTGCGKCSELCPYNVPYLSKTDYSDSLGKKIILKERAYKCDACHLNRRDIPACVQNCLSGALTFGHRLYILKMANRLLAEIKREYPAASLYGIKEFGGLRGILLLKEKPEKFRLPTGDSAEPIKI